VPKVEKTPSDQSVAVGETLKIKIPVIGKGPFNLKLTKDDSGSDEAVPFDESKFTIVEADGIVTITLPSMQSEILKPILK
jgi:hypothetical protein